MFFGLFVAVDDGCQRAREEEEDLSSVFFLSLLSSTSTKLRLSPLQALLNPKETEFWNEFTPSSLFPSFFLGDLQDRKMTSDQGRLIGRENA